MIWRLFARLFAPLMLLALGLFFQLKIEAGSPSPWGGLLLLLALCGLALFLWWILR